ncbi:hypothetical protein A1351_23270 [Methylosinus sp. R-45379]|nr:hypothetical protein A1351_23270 [Methylosinus sp. R-45379]
MSFVISEASACPEGRTAATLRGLRIHSRKNGIAAANGIQELGLGADDRAGEAWEDFEFIMDISV